MGGKNRATPAHLSPDETPAQDEQRTLREPLFQDACACNFFALSELLHRLASEGGETPVLSLDTPPAQETISFPCGRQPGISGKRCQRAGAGCFRIVPDDHHLYGIAGSASRPSRLLP